MGQNTINNAVSLPIPQAEPISTGHSKAISRSRPATFSSPDGVAIVTGEDAPTIADSPPSTAKLNKLTSASINLSVSKSTTDNISAKRKHTNGEPAKVSDSKKPKVENNCSDAAIQKEPKKSRKLTCVLCKAKSKNSFESRYHNEFHRSRRCFVCHIRIDARSVKQHIYSCLLFSGKMSNKEMEDYMTPCVVRLQKK